ncbi:hypothetical protein [Acinetobacter sp. ASP199]|nr:hypothetical protein [Acinetobacter sp. ASP199]UNT58468.1 hypothetical protein IHE35_10065 [Acinetobacter sp. ASP199]
MKIVQEENLHQVEHHLSSGYHIDMMSCLFFALGMLICGFLLHLFVF